MSQYCFRVLSERYLTSEIDSIRWNPKYDLLAISTKRGDVILQRLFWKKAWQISSKVAAERSSSTALSPSNSNSNAAITVLSLSWSPNGKYLAVVYSTGKIIFVEIESGRIVFQIDDQLNSSRTNDDDGGGGVISKWIEFKYEDQQKSKVDTILFDDAEDLLLPLPPMEKSKSTAATMSISNNFGADLFSSNTESQINNLSLLIVGDGGYRLRLFLNGFFHMADLNLLKCLSTDLRISEKSAVSIIPVAVDVSTNFDRLGIAFCSSRSELRFGIFDSPLSSKDSDYWIRLSKRISYLSSSLRYVESTMQKILDSWEDSIGDLDVKLTKYALSKSISTETIGDDFLQMLVFGIASPELEHFMTHSLTDKGLKKLTGSTDNSYQNLFNLLGVNLDCGVSALYHHLTTLQNLIEDDDDSVWTEAIDTVAALSLKITKIYDIAESNARSVNLFVRWLHRCLLRISDENLTSNLTNFSDDDVDSVAKFIQENFCKSIVQNSSDDDVETSTTQFGLEKLGLFLKSGTTSSSASIDDQDNVSSSSSENTSLPDYVKLVRDCIGKVRRRLSIILSERFNLIGPSIRLAKDLFSTEKLSKNITLVHDAEKHCFRLTYAVVTTDSDDEFLITEFNDRSASVIASWKLFSHADFHRSVVNLDYYNSTIVTALVRERKDDETDWKSILYQIDTSNLRTPASPTKSGSFSGMRNQQQLIKLPWNVMKNQSLNDGQFCLVSVSGSRKVGCIVFACRTRLKLLEMEPDEDTTAQSSSLAEDGNASMDVE